MLTVFGLPDSPSKAWFFNEQEKKLVVLRLATNQTGIETHKKFHASQIVESLRDPRCYCVWATALGYAIANAGVTNFNPLIISGYGFSATKTVLMATPQAGVAMASGVVLTVISYFVPNLRCLFWAVSSLIGLAGAVMVKTLDVTTQRGASLAGVYLMGFYNVPWIFMLSLQSSNTAGATKKSFMGVSVAIVYGKLLLACSLSYSEGDARWLTRGANPPCLSAIGNIIGPQLFLSASRP